MDWDAMLLNHMLKKINLIQRGEGDMSTMGHCLQSTLAPIIPSGTSSNGTDHYKKTVFFWTSKKMAIGVHFDMHVVVNDVT